MNHMDHRTVVHHLTRQTTDLSVLHWYVLLLSSLAAPLLYGVGFCFDRLPLLQPAESSGIVHGLRIIANEEAGHINRSNPTRLLHPWRGQVS